MAFIIPVRTGRNKFKLKKYFLPVLKMKTEFVKCENCSRVFDAYKEFVVFRFEHDFCSLECSEKWFDQVEGN